MSESQSISKCLLDSDRSKQGAGPAPRTGVPVVHAYVYLSPYIPYASLQPWTTLGVLTHPPSETSSPVFSTTEGAEGRSREQSHSQ